VAAPVSDEFRERFLREFLDAWPERDVEENVIRSSLRLTVTEEEDGPMLVAELLGYETGFGFDEGDDLAGLVDELARHVANNAEGDRCLGGEGWREYRS
jgi:hypothetical protein